MLTDRYGLPLSTGSAAARDAYVEAAGEAIERGDRPIVNPGESAGIRHGPLGNQPSKERGRRLTGAESFGDVAHP